MAESQNRLGQLIRQGLKRCKTCEEFEAFLAENNVVALPHKLGAPVYCLSQPCGGCEDVDLEGCRKCKQWETIECPFDYDLVPGWGVYVFATREEAEAARRRKLQEAGV